VIATDDIVATCQGAARWMNRLCEALEEGRHVLACFPGGIDVGPVRTEVLARLAAHGLYPTDLHLPAIDWPAENRYPHIPPMDADLIEATGVDQLPPAQRRLWFRYLASVLQPGSGPVVLCWVQTLEGIAELPTSGARLETYWWDGIPSATETRLLCRWRDDAAPDSRRLWREHVLPALVVFDTALVDCLWDPVMSGTLETVLACLREAAAQRGWTQEVIASFGIEHVQAHESVSADDDGPRRYARPWAAGVLGRTDEYGTEVSPAALVACGRDREVLYRVWRGQASLMLPWLDAIRQHLCRRLVRRYGPTWWTRLGPEPKQPEDAEALRRNPHTAEWGYLGHLYRVSPDLRADTRYRDVVARGVELRNKLAHCEAVTYPEFQALWKRWEAVVAVAEQQLEPAP
jgi:hypothetical protein